jgi:signal transduction histidine kinase
VQVAADLSQAEEASILLYDDNKGELRFQAATNLDNPAVRGLRVPVNQSVAGWIVTHCEPLIIEDVKNDDRHFGHVQKVSGLSTTSLLGVPLINKGEVIGVLEAINKNTGYFTTEDQDLLMILGAQAAVAIQNARLFAQSDIIAEFVHELRTPLASLNTAAHLLLSKNVDEDQKEELIDAIQIEITRLSSLATSFLDIARLESGRTQFHFHKINLSILLEECANLMQTQAQEIGLDLQIFLPTDLSPIRGDADKIKQAILNLLSNAIKYNRPNGNIILSAENKDNDVILSVKDGGIGIPESHIEHLFTKFYRVPGSEQQAQGTGLGLSIVKRIVEGHGGKITVESVQNIGTTFSISLPSTPL